MSKNNYLKKVQNQIKKINEIIDFKIMHGLNYMEERRIHRDLIRQLAQARKTQPSFSFMSFFF